MIFFYLNSKKIFVCKKQNTQLLYQINQLLLERNLLQPYQSVLIAVSGGQDSVCLLNIMYKLQSKWKWKLAVIHCDHKWSSNSLLQAKHVSHLVKNMQIHYYQAITTQLVNTEHFARIWRYEILKRVAVLHNYQVIVTAHNGSDRVETVIHNMVRGSGFSGFQSLSWKRKLNSNLRIYKKSRKKQLFSFSNLVIFTWRYTSIESFVYNNQLFVIRPFLNTTRIELQEIIQKWKLSVYLDPSNQNWKIRRNRIRNQLLPYLRQYFNPKVDYVVSNLAEIVHADFLYLETITKYLFFQNRSYVSKNPLYTKYSQLNLQLIQVLPLAMQRRILKRFLDNYTGTSINFQHVEQVRSLIIISADFANISNCQKQNSKNLFTLQKHIDLPNKIKLFIKNNYIYLVHREFKEMVNNIL